ncbi:uncharacterized protein LOC135167696 [Diachasmimorpha longicaudata]|uniref:uncharacterized protein LOC135167696 n=1 Tax=Diachasmimorpha longicaudata TaxID=58733 RepID=UPI0030B90529
MDYGGDVSDASEELFSDDDGSSDVRFTSPDLKANKSFFNLSQTPVLLHHQREETPGKPIVPKTPMTLAPFISKADEWSSEMETPEGKRDHDSIPPETVIVDIDNIDNSLIETADAFLTPAHVKTDDINEDIVPLSQELPPRKKQKRAPKRRIFDKNNTLATVDDDDESDDTSQTHQIIKSRSLIVDPQSKCPVEKLKQLKALQMRLQERRGLETLTDDAIPDDEFLRSCRDLERCDRQPQTEHIQTTPTNVPEGSSLSPTWEDLKTPEEEIITQETVTVTPVATLQTNRQDTYSQIDLGIDHMIEEEDQYLEKTFLETELINIKKEVVPIEEPDEDFRGFPKDEQQSKELWEFQRIFVQQYGGLSPRKLNFQGFSFVEAEISKTIFQNNDIFLNNYLEKYYGIRKQVDPPLATIEDTESEESQRIEEVIPQIQLLPPLFMPVYSGFDTASGNKLFTSVDKIFEEKTKFQRDESTEMHSIDFLMNNQSSMKVQNSISRDKENVQILEDKSIELIKHSDKSEDEKIYADKNINNIVNKSTLLIGREKCDKIASSPIKKMEIVSNAVEVPHEDDVLGYVGLEPLEKPDKSAADSSAVNDSSIKNSSEDFIDCLNEISNLKNKRQRLRLRCGELDKKPSISKPLINQITNENYDPKLSSILSHPRVPDPNDERQINPGVPRDVTPGCGNTTMISPSIDSRQLRNTDYSSVSIDSKHNGQFPGFVTGTGKTAQISEKAWSTGLAMFTAAGKEVGDDVESNLKSVINKPFTSLKLPGVENPTSTSKLSAGFGSKLPTNISNDGMGFKTGNGGPIKLSEVAQNKMKASMQEFSLNLDDDDPDLLALSNMKKKIWARRRETIEKIPLKTSPAACAPELGFKTAGGGSIKLSEATLKQMKAGLEAYTSDVNEDDLDFSDLQKKVSTVRHKTRDPIGDDLKTSRRSELPLKRTSLPFMSKPFTPLNIKIPEVRPNSTPSTSKSTSGFTTAGGGEIHLSEAVQRKIETDLAAFNAEDIENDPVTKSSSTNSRNAKLSDSVKRKNPSDDVTPFGRKRARTAGTDLQARILFHEINEEDEEIIQSSLALENNNDTENDRILPFKNMISEKIKPITKYPTSRWSDSSCPPVSNYHPIQRRPYSLPTNPSTEKTKTDKKIPLTNQELIPDDIVFDSQEFLESYEKISTKIKQNDAAEKRRNEVIKKQEDMIEAKRKNRERKEPGSLLLIKEKEKSLMISLEQLCLPGTLPAPRDPREFSCLNIDQAVSTLTSSTAQNYRFNLEAYQDIGRTWAEGIPVGDGTILIPDVHNFAGIMEFKRSFLASPGVDPNLLPDNWLENHYKWIVWKLASMDRLKFTKIKLPKSLTPDQVLKQLKYRYDREIDRTERSIIRKMLEKDEVASHRMILCVSRIKRTTINNETTISMELTDGWYSVIAALDTPMINNILDGKINEGTKLMIYGAQLINNEEGCHPLEAPSNLRLKIHTNSTRRAKWFTKLGLQKYSGPMELSLRYIHPNGGLIGKVSAVVSRVYPIIYKETTSDGQVIFRNAKSEERAQMSFINNHESGSITSLCRDVKSCLKIRIADGCVHGIVTIWQNAEESSEMFKEGNSISIIHGTASGKRTSELQINATRWTTFDVRMCRKKFSFPERIFTPLSDTMTQGFSPNYGEFDTVGIVVSIGPAPHGMKNFETMYLAYRNEMEEDSFLSILFWEGIGTYGYSDIATIGSIVCCVNCEWRRNTYRSIPTAFCSERTIITRNPRQGSHLRRAFDELKCRIADTSNYVNDCAARIQAEVLKKSGSYSVTPVRGTELTPKDRRSAALKGRIERLQSYGPVPNLSPIHLTGSSKVSLDFKSPLSR